MGFERARFSRKTLGPGSLLDEALKSEQRLGNLVDTNPEHPRTCRAREGTHAAKLQNERRLPHEISLETFVEMVGYVCTRLPEEAKRQVYVRGKHPTGGGKPRTELGLQFVDALLHLLGQLDGEKEPHPRRR
jgi:hypothetical protein